MSVVSTWRTRKRTRPHDACAPQGRNRSADRSAPWRPRGNRFRGLMTGSFMWAVKSGVRPPAVGVPQGRNRSADGSAPWRPRRVRSGRVTWSGDTRRVRSSKRAPDAGVPQGRNRSMNRSAPWRPRKVSSQVCVSGSFGRPVRSNIRLPGADVPQGRNRSTDRSAPWRPQRTPFRKSVKRNSSMFMGGRGRRGACSPRGRGRGSRGAGAPCRARPSPPPPRCIAGGPRAGPRGRWARWLGRRAGGRALAGAPDEVRQRLDEDVGADAGRSQVRADGADGRVPEQPAGGPAGRCGAGRGEGTVALPARAGHGGATRGRSWWPSSRDARRSGMPTP